MKLSANDSTLIHQPGGEVKEVSLQKLLDQHKAVFVKVPTFATALIVFWNGQMLVGLQVENEFYEQYEERITPRWQVLGMLFASLLLSSLGVALLLPSLDPVLYAVLVAVLAFLLLLIP